MFLVALVTFSRFFFAPLNVLTNLGFRFLTQPFTKLVSTFTFYFLKTNEQSYVLCEFYTICFARNACKQNSYKSKIPTNSNFEGKKTCIKDNDLWVLCLFHVYSSLKITIKINLRFQSVLT